MVNLAGVIEKQLPAELLEIIKTAGELAADRGQSLYLVGGAVRDIFLGLPVLDIDLVLEGDAPCFARQLAGLQGVNVVTHPRFGTATVSRGAISLDIVTARTETYSRPGSLPIVKPGTILEDLFRRDFSINAMAAHLISDRFGEIVDPYNGKNDLDLGLIRVLHRDSFADDPTRIWRAIRYEQRLGFKLEKETESLLRRNVYMMDKVSGDRLRHELERILKEDYPEKSIHRAEELGALQRFLSSIEGNGWLANRFEHARRVNAGSKPDEAVYLALLAWRLDEAQLEIFIGRLRFRREVSRVLRDIPKLKKDIPALESKDLKPSSIFRLLEHRQPATITAGIAATDNTLLGERLTLYLSDLRSVTPVLNGDDLNQMGFPPGKRIGHLLKILRDSKLDGFTATVEEEQQIVHRWLNKQKC